MIINLNHNLTQQHSRKLDREAFNKTLEYKIGQDYSRLTEISGDDFQMGFLQLVSNAYSLHEKISIAPQDLWYIVLTEIAQQIKKRPEEFRPLFTNTPNKTEITVPTSDPTKINLNLVIDQLHDLVPIDLSMFLVELSTSTVGSKTAFNAALCDGLQVFYNYGTYCCGIPAIKVLGTTEDWSNVAKSAISIASAFRDANLPDMVLYMVRVTDIIHDIWEHTFREVDIDFWKGIFTSKNVGSGGELVISGWITKLYYEVCKLPKIENFSKSISIVPYKNLDTGMKFIGVHGAFKRNVDEDGFIGCDYAEIIFKNIKET